MASAESGPVVVSPDSPPAAPVVATAPMLSERRCVECANSIHRLAMKCGACGAYQWGWKKWLGAITLVAATTTGVFAAIDKITPRVIAAYRALFPSAHMTFKDLGDVDEELRFSVYNSGKDPITIEKVLIDEIHPEVAAVLTFGKLWVDKGTPVPTGSHLVTVGITEIAPSESLRFTESDRREDFFAQHGKKTIRVIVEGTRGTKTISPLEYRLTLNAIRAFIVNNPPDPVTK
jgi:hypothetical protein